MKNIITVSICILTVFLSCSSKKAGKQSGSTRNMRLVSIYNISEIKTGKASEQLAYKEFGNFDYNIKGDTVFEKVYSDEFEKGFELSRYICKKDPRSLEDRMYCYKLDSNEYGRSGKVINMIVYNSKQYLIVRKTILPAVFVLVYAKENK